MNLKINYHDLKMETITNPDRGVAIFVTAYSGLLLEQSTKIMRPLMPSADPIRPASLVSDQQGVETLLRNELSPFGIVFSICSL